MWGKGVECFPYWKCTNTLSNFIYVWWSHDFVPGLLPNFKSFSFNSAVDYLSSWDHYGSVGFYLIYGFNSQWIYNLVLWDGLGPGNKCGPTHHKWKKAHQASWEISMKFCVFDTFLGHISTFFKLWSQTRKKRRQMCLRFKFCTHQRVCVLNFSTKKSNLLYPTV